jgi:hypothetical protein
MSAIGGRAEIKYRANFGLMNAPVFTGEGINAPEFYVPAAIFFAITDKTRIAPGCVYHTVVDLLVEIISFEVSKVITTFK